MPRSDVKQLADALNLSETMTKTVLNWKQVVGLEPISKKDFAKALEESEKAIKKDYCRFVCSNNGTPEFFKFGQVIACSC